MPESGVRRRVAVIGVGLLVVAAAAVAVESPAGPARRPSAQARSGSPESGTGVRSDPSSDGQGRGGQWQSGRPLPGVAATGPATTTGTGTGDVPSSPSQALGGLLNARAQALTSGGRTGWLATVDPAAKRFRSTQEQVFDRVRSLRPVRWSYRVNGGSALPQDRRDALGAPAWRADVNLEYQLEPGTPVVSRRQFLTVARRDGAWLITGDTDGETGRDVWDLGPIARARSARCLVIGARARQAQVRRLAAECPRAAATVDQAWGTTWSRRVVVVVPDSVKALAVLLGQSGAKGSQGTAGLDNTAAVTVGPADERAEEVLVNGKAFDQLNPLGRQVVLTHELVHVATRDTGARSAPIWLAEGYADHVAYAGTGLSAQQIAGEALDDVRSGDLPTALPGTDAFDTSGDRAAQAYGQAWAAVGAIAGRVKGAAGLKTFYERASAGSSGMDAALKGARLRDTDALVEIWQARLIDLAT